MHQVAYINIAISVDLLPWSQQGRVSQTFPPHEKLSPVKKYPTPTFMLPAAAATTGVPCFLSRE